ncbi:MAG: hypothetical protein GY805_03325 [Chloroflexi bacterium]|nr:hypothetical protein [Chloroflexota bacterium]
MTSERDLCREEENTRKMPKLTPSRVLKLQLWGWILFVICALLFIASSIKNGDMLSLIGSIIFLIACAFFMAPLVDEFGAEGGHTAEDAAAEKEDARQQ